MKKIAITTIADELRITPKTIYRVLNNEPSVKDATRKMVIDALNAHGFFDQHRIAKEKVVVDIQTNPWLIRQAEALISQLPESDFKVIRTDHKTNLSGFLHEVDDAASTVYFSDPDSAIIEKVRDANPDVLQINAYGYSGGDITVGEDHLSGAIKAAKYLYETGHRNIAICSLDNRPGHRSRGNIFAMELLVEHSDVHLRRIAWDYQHLDEVIRKLQPLPDAIFATCAGVARDLFQYAQGNRIAIPDDVSLLCYDPSKEMDPSGKVDLTAMGIDSIEFNPLEVIDLVRYYINKRPLFKHRGSLKTQVGNRLAIRHSVKDLNKK